MATRYQYRVIVVIPAALLDTLNALVSQQLDPAGGALTFTSQLSADGQEPATHYWAASSLVLSATMKLAGLAQAFPAVKAWIWQREGDQTALARMFAGCDNVNIGEITPQAVLDACGLATVVPSRLA